jgi:DNA repair exonuclease SbcCD ATPase subunit
MLTPTRLRIQNLFTHTDTTFLFIEGQMIMLLGNNLDDAGANSNGSGKSAILEGITLAITGDVYRKIGKEDYIKYGELFTKVDFELQDRVDKKIVNIKRKIYANSNSAELTLTVDGVTPKHLPTVSSGVKSSEGNKEIFKLLGITKEDFLNFYVIGQGNTDSFFSANDTKQKEIISRFSNFTQIDALIKQLEDNNDSIIDDINGLKYSITSMEEMITFLNTELEGYETIFQNEKQERIQYYENLLSNENRHLDQAMTELERLSTVTRTKEIQRDKLKVLDVKVINAKLAKEQENLKELRSQYKETLKYQSELESTTGQVVKCPMCLASFIPESDLNVENLLENIPLVNLLLEEQSVQIDASELRINDFKAALLSVKEVESQKKVLNNEISSLYQTAGNLTDDINDWNKNKENYNKKIDEVKKSSPKEKLLSLKDKLTGQMNARNALSEKLEALEDVKKENDFHIHHLGKKGFKTFLANKSIRTIQDICNYYLQKFDTDLQTHISGYTILKTGELRDKIEISVLKGGMNKGLFNKYSGGEKSRVNICSIISINKLINNSSPTGGLDLICFDEIGYLDSTGQEEVIKILSKANITCVLVMHNVDNFPYKNKVIVTKQNGVSKIS